MTDLKKIAAGWGPERLEALRRELRQSGVAGIVIPRWDEQQFEYVPPSSERLAWATGFSGSWGVAIVALDRAAIFVDGRYTTQAQKEVSDDHFEHRHLLLDPPENWLGENARAGEIYGYDPSILTPALHATLRDALRSVNATLKPLDRDLFAAAWIDRPEPPLNPARAYDPQRAGASSAEKRAVLSKRLEAMGIDILVETQPDNVNWIFNLRGGDLPYCPTVRARALLHRSGEADLFIDKRKLDAGEPYEFADVASGVTIHDWDKFFDVLGSRMKPNARIAADPKFSPVGAIELAEKHGAWPVLTPDPLTEIKAVKNPAELKSIRAVVKRDSALWVKFLYWLEKTVPERDAAGDPVTELEAENYIDGMRRREPDFTDSSFRTISAADGNATMAHYAAPMDGGAPITRNSVYLVDSGAQFSEGGTTDTTRTLCFDDQPDEIKLRYTCVLKGHIALATQPFPDGTFGHQIDTLARMALWRIGLDYDHGTGHGVGHYLSVHEYPQRLQKAPSEAPIRAGMLITNEPGYYEAGRYGMRTENLCEIVEDKPGFLRFRELALIPIQTRMILIDKLTKEERDWVDAYHARVRQEIEPLIDEAPIRDWLRAATQPLPGGRG